MAKDTKQPDKTDKQAHTATEQPPDKSASKQGDQQKETRLHTFLRKAINAGLHVAPFIAVAITWSLSGRAFASVEGDAIHIGRLEISTAHIGLLAIEFAFLMVTSSLVMGFIRGRAHNRAAWVAAVALVVIIGLNCATGFYTSPDGYLLPNAPSYLETWRTHALAWTPIISIFLLVVFAALDGDIQERIGAKAFALWETAHERRTDQLNRRNAAQVSRLNAKANAAQQSIQAQARLAMAQQLTRSVKRQAKSKAFKKQMDGRADNLLDQQSEIDALLGVITGGQGNG